MKKILLVEDNESLNRGISFKLSREGMKVFCAKNIKEAKDILDKEQIHLILLDVGLPDGNGFDFCKEIRKKSDVLIIFLTACDEEVDIVTGLDMGGDDYITKPFSLMILLSKINALFRRNLKDKEKDKLISGDIIFYQGEMKITKNNEEISLSKTELKLLRCLMINAKQVISKEQFLNKLWDIDGDFIDSNTVAVNIKRLREKIEDVPSSPKYIKTVRGIGYTWTEGCVNQ
ncbi:transcriptional regulatory protein YycF [Clostridium acetireducens DSM 10703]|uniref:Stage 0 sporulation protein A homolog n=1 Tax=Clostridium acetireducens DSM 10703 TaxID=1121290 RepID=A0A1E8EVU3_9CLOT|nr:response regulator transcription factor [Clostridium acetireducens]OFI01381.1 transcriptional regulatory protein YycF [Clostridium acetireducens DSM 10703]